MKIRVVASSPVDVQDDIHELIGKEFEIVPYRDFEVDTRKEMKALGEVAIKVGKYPYILNKDEYEVVE